MKITSLAIPEVKLIEPKVFDDNRGFFFESYSLRSFQEVGIDNQFVQDNFSLSKNAGIVRGLHFQIPPYAQAKLIRVIRGSIWDVAVDIRQGSPTYGKYVAVELTAKSIQALFIPKGFAHGFATLEPNTEIQYKTDGYYAPDHDSGILWNDSDLAIEWPVETDSVILSDKDAVLPGFKDIEEVFDYSSTY